MSRLALIAADEKMLLELGHILNLQDFVREAESSGLWGRGSSNNPAVRYVISAN
jgi:hypothetical protein